MCCRKREQRHKSASLGCRGYDDDDDDDDNTTTTTTTNNNNNNNLYSDVLG
jgi:hypothetical protein